MTDFGIKETGWKLRFLKFPPCFFYCYSNFGYIFTTDCTDHTDFSSQEATMAGCRTIRMAGAAEAQNPYNPCNPLWKNTSET